MTIDAVELQEHLAGLDYPVSREDLVRWAQESGASTELLQALRTLPADQFTSPHEVARSFTELC